MGLMNLFSKQAAVLMPLPRGSLTVDREGRVITSTLPQSFPAEFAEEIALDVVTVFKDAQAARIVLREIIVRYANLKVTARELRGGAIIFLAPQTFSSKPS
jgi:hypothetical protein